MNSIPLLQMVEFVGLSGKIEFDTSGLRTQFEMDLMELQMNGLVSRMMMMVMIMMIMKMVMVVMVAVLMTMMMMMMMVMVAVMTMMMMMMMMMMVLSSRKIL